MYGTKDYVCAVKVLLESYPNLQTLAISVEGRNTTEYVPSQELSATDGNLKHLKTVAISSFEGSESELDLVRYILGNANAMEEMNIIYSNEFKKDVAKQTVVRDKCSKFAKVSPSAVIIFSI
ncbi:hypothetical protein AQUCO_02200166v1 [Aquilegia coerulea]|uniref:FBD domain-containing protein n=1 Tax=Aquilegia coerulea TaxID=218851 RepID=A0A2G5DDJ6_AQUCA|nr:hypothetical protein AQUCO_02200166v1 [Aquilegia coerulea]